MTSSHMKTTQWFYHFEGDVILRTRFTYGYNYIKGNKDAYVSFTQETHRKRKPSRYDTIERYVEYSGGIASKHLVETLAPHLLPLHQWHLSSVVTGPMHYIPNALYWWDIIHGRDTLSKWYNPNSSSNTSPDTAKGYLISHINYGALPNDTLHDPFLMTREGLEVWLKNRQTALVAKLHGDCDTIALAKEECE